MDAGEGVDLSVVVPAYRAGATLPRVLDAVLAQRFPGRLEVVVVASADRREELPALTADPRMRVEARVPRLPAGPARNLGAELARGAAIAFIDADAIPRPDWLARLAAASEGGRWCVAGAIANGTPASVAGTVEYLVEFFDLSPARIEPCGHGATANLLVPRPLWERYGPFPEDLEGCEDTWLTTRLWADGRLRFARDAVVVHLNRTRLRTVLGHQYQLGGAHARLALEQGRPPRFPVSHAARETLGRVHWFQRTLTRWTPDGAARACRLAPLLALGFGSWGAGLAVEARALTRRRRRARASAR